MPDEPPIIKIFFTFGVLKYFTNLVYTLVYTVRF
jgi:hypothetical protein